MPSRRIKPPPVQGTWAWLYREIRAALRGTGQFIAAREDTLGTLEAKGQSRVEERLAEWCAARRMAMRLVDYRLEIRKLPPVSRTRITKPVLASSMQEVIVRGLF